MSFAVDYYSHKKFVTTNFRKEADFIICTIPEEINRNLTGKIIKEINLGNSSFVNIRENNDKILK